MARILRIVLIPVMMICIVTRGVCQITFTVTSEPEECYPGFAILKTEGSQAGDTIEIRWSANPQLNVNSVALPAGAYSVNLKLKYKRDTVYRNIDTTLFFTVEKVLCPLFIPKYFSPNGDNYNDQFSVGNIHKYPQFELSVYNKWGQRVHHQKHDFSPWDGKWFGIDLPDGTYYYVLFYDENDKSKMISGDVTILR